MTSALPNTSNEQLEFDKNVNTTDDSKRCSYQAEI